MAIIVKTENGYEAYQSIEALSNLGVALARREESCEERSEAIAIECDELITPLIVLLNNMGFKTKACCSGHAYYDVTTMESFHSHKGYQYTDKVHRSLGYIYFEEDNSFLEYMRYKPTPYRFKIDDEKPIIRWEAPDDEEDPMVLTWFNVHAIQILYDVAKRMEVIRTAKIKKEEPEKESDHLRDLFECSPEERALLLGIINNLKEEFPTRRLYEMLCTKQNEESKKEGPEKCDVESFTKNVMNNLEAILCSAEDVADEILKTIEKSPKEDHYWWKMLVDQDFYNKETLEWLEKVLKNLENE